MGVDRGRQNSQGVGLGLGVDSAVEGDEKRGEKGELALEREKERWAERKERVCFPNLH